MCGQPSTAHSNYFTGHFPRIWSILCFDRTFGQETTRLGRNKVQPLWLSEQVIVCQSYFCVCVCVCVVRTFIRLISRQKRCCRRLPESGTPLCPADSKMGHIHTQTPVETTQECPQISLFRKPGAFKFKRGRCQETSKHWYLVFCQAMSKKKNMPDTYVGLLGTQPSKNGTKKKGIELWTS